MVSSDSSIFGNYVLDPGKLNLMKIKFSTVEIKKKMTLKMSFSEDGF